MQNNTMHLWYSKSNSACSWDGPSGLTYAPGGDLLFGTLRDTAQTWNTTVMLCPLLECMPEPVGTAFGIPKRAAAKVQRTTPAVTGSLGHVARQLCAGCLERADV